MSVASRLYARYTNKQLKDTGMAVQKVGAVKNLVDIAESRHNCCTVALSASECNSSKHRCVWAYCPLHRSHDILAKQTGSTR